MAVETIQRAWRRRLVRRRAVEAAGHAMWRASWSRRRAFYLWDGDEDPRDAAYARLARATGAPGWDELDTIWIVGD